MEDFFDHDKADAFVYLLSEGDDKNKAITSEEMLLVIRKNHRKTFLLREVSHLKVETKKQLFPLILGGIITPFAFLSYFVNIFLPWVHLISVLVGMLLFYIGWAGRLALTIVNKNGDELVYYLPSISENLLAFIDFINTRIKNPSKSIHENLLYFIVKPQHQSILFGKTTKTQDQIFPLKGLTFQQLKNHNKALDYNELVAINPKKSGVEIRFEFDISTNMMRPILDLPILPESKEEIIVSDIG